MFGSSSRLRTDCWDVLVKVDSAVGELAERSALLDLGSPLGVLSKPVSHVPDSIVVVALSSFDVLRDGMSNGVASQKGMSGELNVRIRQP